MSSQEADSSSPLPIMESVTSQPERPKSPTPTNSLQDQDEEIKIKPPSPKISSLNPNKNIKNLPTQLHPTTLHSSSESEYDSSLNGSMTGSLISQSSVAPNTKCKTNKNTKTRLKNLPEITAEEKNKYRSITQGPSFTYSKLKYLKNSTLNKNKKLNFLKYETPSIVNPPPSDTASYLSTLLEKLLEARNGYKQEITTLANFRQKTHDNFQELFLDKHEFVTIECQCKCKKTIRTKHEYWVGFLGYKRNEKYLFEFHAIKLLVQRGRPLEN